MKYASVFIFYSFLGLSIATKEDKRDFNTIANKTYPTQANIKEEAFIVLRNKCNSCHATKKRTTIFTLENMDSLARDIHKQVFVKRKMPKGKKVKLTESESRALQQWFVIILEGYKSAANEKSR